MCIYYLISFTKSIYFLLNFQIPFMFWITILPLNILYYPTNESIRFSNNLIFLTVLRFLQLLGWVWELFWGFLQFQLLFLGFFPAFWLGLGSCFGDFCSFSYFLPVFLRLFGWVWGAVLGISAVPATFYRFFSGFLAEFGLFLLHLVGTKSELLLLAFWPAHLLWFAHVSRVQ